MYMWYVSGHWGILCPAHLLRGSQKGNHWMCWKPRRFLAAEDFLFQLANWFDALLVLNSFVEMCPRWVEVGWFPQHIRIHTVFTYPPFLQVQSQQDAAQLDESKALGGTILITDRKCFHPCSSWKMIRKSCLMFKATERVASSPFS